MRKLITTTFVTLDGIMQAPGGPEEDTSGGFQYGGWSMKYWDDIMGKRMGKIMEPPFDLLLGKKTYDIFAAYWPTAKDEQDIAKKFNGTTKYVVSDVPMEPSWEKSVLITGDVPAEIQKLKDQDGPELQVHGSGNLIQTLLKHHLIDTMIVWTFPVTIGNGKRLFAEGTMADGFKLVDSVVSTTGVIIAAYEPAGPLKTGSFKQ